MKNKKTMGIILSAILIAVTFCSCSVPTLTIGNKQIQNGTFSTVVEGRFISGKNSSIIIDNSGTPIVMVNKSGDNDIFDGFYSGDKIAVTCGLIRETYPASTDVYSCKFLEAGGFSDIPNETMQQLKDMGWV